MEMLFSLSSFEVRLHKRAAPFNGAVSPSRRPRQVFAGAKVGSKASIRAAMDLASAGNGHEDFANTLKNLP